MTNQFKYFSEKLYWEGCNPGLDIRGHGLKPALKEALEVLAALEIFGPFSVLVQVGSLLSDLFWILECPLRVGRVARKTRHQYVSLDPERRVLNSIHVIPA